VGSLSSVHIKLAVETSDALVAKHRLLHPIVVSMHNEGELVGVGVLWSAGDEGTAIHGDEPCLDHQVRSVGEDQSAALDCYPFEDGGIHIDEQSHPQWHIHQIAVDWRWIHSPGGCTAPFECIEEGITDEDILDADRHCEGVGHCGGVRTGSHYAADGRGSLGNVHTVHLIDQHTSGRINVKIAASQDQSVPAENISIPRLD